jgi:hypothetical protein
MSHLIEPGVKYFLSETLKQCRQFQITYYNLLLNICIFLCFMALLGTILLMKYRGKLTPAEKEMKNREKHYYILSKIKNYVDAKQKARQELISGLPLWENEYDSMMPKSY